MSALDQELSENVWFVWSKTSYSGDVTMRDGRTDERTREDRATQPFDAGRLSFAIIIIVMAMIVMHQLGGTGSNDILHPRHSCCSYCHRCRGLVLIIIIIIMMIIFSLCYDAPLLDY